MSALLLVMAQWAAAQCSGAACPNPCTACTFQPVQGTDPSPSEYQDLFKAIAQRQGAADLPDVATLETGADRTRSAAEFPCRLLPAVGATESSILEFCGGDGPTVISFDCGFGVMQVTSGASSYPGIQTRADINIAAGADILATKWNDNADFGGSFGVSDASVLESWYFAVWAYNGFVYRNNPNSPDHPADRPPFRSPGGLSRGSYPYQELVWGFLEFPLVKDGVTMWDSVPISYPDPTTIPNQSGLFSVNPPLPTPSHPDNCVEQCPPSGCPPPDQRELIVDDADANFVIDGAVQTNDTGGFRDRFLSAGVAPAGAPTVHAHYEGIAPSSGTFDFAGFIPLDPADCSDVHVIVHARGAAKAFSLNQNVNGGFFQSLGQVVLLQGQPVTVDVTNESGDDAIHAVGFDAFRFTWVGDGAAADGDACTEDVDCAGDSLCPAGTCVAGCEAQGCTPSDVCNTATGSCAAAEGEGEGDVGEGEGEGEGEGVIVVPTPKPACGCSVVHGVSGGIDTAAGAAAFVALFGTFARRRRRTALGLDDLAKFTP